MEIKEMADIFLNSTNFASHALLTLAPTSSYALNLKALIKVSKVSWTFQLSYEIIKSSLETKFDKTNFISPKKTTSQKPASFRVILAEKYASASTLAWSHVASCQICIEVGKMNDPERIHDTWIEYCSVLIVLLKPLRFYFQSRGHSSRWLTISKSNFILE